MLSYFTVFPRVPFRTDTVVFIRFGVNARRSIDTGVVRATVVQIFIAHTAAPVFLTSALPRRRARPVYASRVRNTVVTELALPTEVAHAFSRHQTATVNEITALLADRRTALVSHPAI